MKPLTDEELDRIADEHSQMGQGPHSSTACAKDSMEWPCVEARLVSELRRLREDRAAFKQEADDLRRNYLRETKELALAMDRAEAKLAELRRKTT